MTAVVAGGACAWAPRFASRSCTDPLDATGVGYLYRLAADRFEQVNAAVWVCREPVTPLDYVVIQSADYIGWLANGD